MQVTSSGWPVNQAASYRPVSDGFLLSPYQLTASGVAFFTINTSIIGGPDVIKSGGTAVAFFDKYQYSDYTDYLLNWSVERKFGQYPFGTMLAQADVELDNTRRNFNFDQTTKSGLQPNRPFKISVGFNGELMNQIVGFAGVPESDYLARMTHMHGFDVLDYIANYSLTSSGNVATTTSGVLSNKRADEVIEYYLRALGFSTGQFVLDQSVAPSIGVVSVTDRKLGEVFDDLAHAEQAMLFVDENGIIRFWNRQHFTTISGSQFALTTDNIIDMRYESTPIINDVQIIAKPRAINNKQKVWELPSYLTLAPNGITTVWADFSDDEGELPVTSVDAPVAIASATTSLFSTNSQTDGSGSSLDANITVYYTYLFGKTYLVQFNNAGSTNAYLTQLILYGTPAKVSQRLNYRFTDPDSIDRLGRNPANNGEPIVIENSYIQDNSSAASLAQAIVSSFKYPNRRYRVKIFSNPALQIGDRGTLQDENETKTVFIIGITRSRGENGEMSEELILEERALVTYFRIAVSAIGGIDSIAP